MSARLKNKSAGEFPRSLILPLLSLILPYPFIIAADVPSFSILFFTGLTTVEFLLCALLEYLRLFHSLRRRRYLLVDYLNRTIIGLPLTVYLCTLVVPGYAGFVRFLPALLHFSMGRNPARSVLYSFFFAAGLIAFAAMKEGDLPGARTISLASLAVLISSALIIRETAVRKAQKKSLKHKIESGRLSRRNIGLGSKLDLLIRSYLPENRAAMYRGRLRSESGLYFGMAADFPGLHESARDFQNAAGYPNASEAVVDFEAEWDRYIRYIRAEAEKIGHWPGAFSGYIMSASLLKSADKDVFRENWKMFFQSALLCLSLCEFTERGRRALLHRGRRGWGVRLLLAQGRCIGFPGSGQPLSWNFAGPLPAQFENVFQTPHDSEKSTLFLQPELRLNFGRVFELSGDSPWPVILGLRKEYSEPDRPLIPAKDFFEKINFNYDKIFESA